MKLKQQHYALLLASVLSTPLAMAEDAMPATETAPAAAEAAAAPAAEAAAAPEAPEAAAAPEVAGPYSMSRSIEVGGGGHHVSGGNGDWNSAFIDGVWQTDTSNVFDWIVQNDRRFGETGTAFNGGWNHDINQDWFGRLEFGKSSAGTFWADKHYGAAINRKWLADRNLVSTFGFAYNDNRQGYSDRVYTAGLIYYFDGPWVIEGGIHRNLSNPGSVISTQGYGAVTYGRDRWRQIVLSVNSGSEGYMPVGNSASQQVFDSQYYSLGWKEWIGPHWGVHATVDYYHGTYYQRSGGSAAVFWDLP